VVEESVKNEKKHIKRKTEKDIMKIILLGGCNWLGTTLMNKLLSEKKSFHLTWVDNLSSDYSSRHFTWDFEYLRDDCFSFQYGDINNISFLESIITKDSIVVYNIWNDPNSIIGFEHVCSIVKKHNNKLIYTSNETMVDTFECIVKKKNIQNVVGIKYIGELVGYYDIFNKRDIIDTIHYYESIGVDFSFNDVYSYYTMESASQFIYFFLIQDMENNILIEQPTQNYITHI
jgi:hypothetical protein